MRAPGRHRARPPNRWVASLAVTDVLLIGASLIALYATAVAPDGRAAADTGVTVPTSTAPSTTSSVPAAPTTTAGPLTLPSIGAEGAWDPSSTTVSTTDSTTDSTTAPSSQAAGTADTTPAMTTQEAAPASDTAQSTTGSYSWTWTYSSRSSRTTTAPSTTDAPPPDPTEEPTMPTDPLEEIIDDVLTP